MIFIKGTTYNTTADAARLLGVSTKTLRTYIAKEIIPEPPEISYGLRMIRYFPDEYLSRAKKSLENYRKNIKSNK